MDAGRGRISIVALCRVLLGLPESPRWLLSRKGDREAGMEVLQRIEPEASKAEIAAEADEIIAASSEKASSGHFWTMRLRKPIMLAILIAFFNQLSGINAILYSHLVYSNSPAWRKGRLVQSIGIGVTNLVFTFVGLWLIDRLGRRTLLYIGSFGYIGSLGLVAWAFFSGHLTLVPICIFAFIAAHSVGQGTVIWVFISEIFPIVIVRKVRRWAVSRTGSSRLANNFLSEDGICLPARLRFLVFCRHDGSPADLGKTQVPETKGVPLEQIQKQLGIE